MKISKVPASNGNGDAIHIDHVDPPVDRPQRPVQRHHATARTSTTACSTSPTPPTSSRCRGTCCTTTSSARCVGHSDSNASEDTGHLRVTYHHNLFSNCDQRNPRVRFGNPVHVYNNYYVHTVGYSYGIATTENAGVLVEGNYFENIADPTHLGEGSSGPGNLVARNNFLVNSGPDPDQRQRRVDPVLLHRRRRRQREVHRHRRRGHRPPLNGSVPRAPAASAAGARSVLLGRVQLHELQGRVADLAPAAVDGQRVPPARASPRSRSRRGSAPAACTRRWRSTTAPCGPSRPR